MAIRVFHGDDSEPFRRLIAALLDGDEIALVGEAARPDELVRGVEREQPDVVLLDQLGGGDLVERLRAAAPAARIVVLSGHRPEAGDPSLVAAADAWVAKSAGTEEFRAAIRGG
jgi:DNA-binding NarL/FixJ family response regulator